jgi:hypothetical protein
MLGETIYDTVPRESIPLRVLSSGGVEARTQTVPSESLMATLRPPSGRKPKRLNELQRLVKLGPFAAEVYVPREDPEVVSNFARDSVSHGGDREEGR